MFDVEVLALEDGTSPFESWFERLPTGSIPARDIRAAQRLWKEYEARKRRS